MKLSAKGCWRSRSLQPRSIGFAIILTGRTMVMWRSIVPIESDRLPNLSLIFASMVHDAMLQHVYLTCHLRMIALVLCYVVTFSFYTESNLTKIFMSKPFASYYGYADLVVVC